MNVDLSSYSTSPMIFENTPPDFYRELRPEQFRKLNDEARLAKISLPPDFERRCVEALYKNFLERSGQYSERTLIQFHSNIEQFISWCSKQNLPSLPCTGSTLEKYLKSRSKDLHRNTLKSHIWAISKSHILTGYPDPYDDIYVRGTTRAIVKQKIKRRESIAQAKPFRLEHLTKLMDIWSINNSLLEHRDLTLLSVAWDSLLRESELVRIQARDIEVADNGSATLLIPHTKTNQTGNDEFCYLTPSSVELLKLQAKKIRTELGASGKYGEKYLFVPYRRSGRPDRNSLEKNRHLNSGAVDSIFWRAHDALQLDGNKFSGHSARVGAAIDLFESGKGILDLQHSGRWSTSSMPYRYTKQSRSLINNGIRDLRG